MAEPSLLFPASEFEDRTRRLQAALAADDIDALLLTSPADIFYVTGFLTRFWESPARPWFLVVPAQGAPVAVIPAIGAPLMARTWIRDIRTWPAPDPEDDGVSLLTETLREVSGGGRIGTPMGLETSLRMPLADFERLSQRLAPAQFVDGTTAIQRTREIKSEAEIARIRTTCSLAGAAFDDIAEMAHPGVSVAKIFRDFQAALLRHGADWVSYVAGGAGPAGYGDVIAPADDIALQNGDVLMLDTGAVKDGYFCDFDRNFFVGTPSDDARRVHEALWDVTEEAMTTLRPGMTAAQAHDILAGGLIRRGLTPVEGRLGHGLGVTLTEWPSFTPRDTTPLRAGMVLTLEPSAYVGSDTFLTHEENIVLRDTGPELLSPRASRIGQQAPS